MNSMLSALSSYHSHYLWGLSVSPFPLLLHLDSGKSQEPGRPRQTSPHSPLPPPDSLWLCSIISSKARITSNVNFKPRWSPLLSWSQLYQPQEMWDLREIWVNSHCLDKLIRGAQQIKAEMDMYSRETKSCWGKRGGKLRLTLLFLKEKKKTQQFPFNEGVHNLFLNPHQSS